MTTTPEILNTGTSGLPSTSSPASVKLIGRPPVGLAVRFWRMVDKNGPIPQHCPELGPCWIWTGARYGDYGRMLGLNRNHRVAAHRVAFFLQYGRWPVPCALHRCDNRECVRWSHIYEGTYAENMQDMFRKGRNVCGGAKLKEEDVRQIRKLCAGGTPHKEIAKAFGVGKSNISMIACGYTWKAVTACLLLSAFVFGGELPNAPHLSVRHDPVETYPADERLKVHNSPSTLHRSWIARHPHLFGLIVVGAGAGIGAGISLSQRRGVCMERYANGYTYVGTNPCPRDK